MRTVILVLIALAVGALICFLCVKQKLQTVQRLDEETQQKNTELKEQSQQLTKELTTLFTSKALLDQAIEQLQVQKTTMMDSLSQAKQNAEMFENQALELAEKNIEISIEKMSQRYKDAEESCKKEYELVLEECAQSVQSSIQAYETERLNQTALIQQIENMLTELRSKAESAVAAAKRSEEMRTAADFYRIQLSELDLQEIKMLRNVSPYLRDKEPLNKVIWKCYYENPTSDLIGRVIGSGVHTGIYKITNLENQMCYVGQAVNLSDRWKQHIKRGVGADQPTRNKLYPVMFELGPENFSFEIIEECDKSLLDEREKFWQDFFKAKEYGYSIK